MFDPGWRAPRARGPEDTGTLDAGADPVSVIDRLDTRFAISPPAPSCLQKVILRDIARRSNKGPRRMQAGAVPQREGV